MAQGKARVGWRAVSGVRSPQAVAAVLAEMADLLLIQGGEPHRARAFSRTAQVIDGLREPLDELIRRGQLQRMAGIGAGSMERIKAILQTGTCADHQRLLARVPAGLRAVLKVRGMGVRTTRLVREHLHIVDVAGLDAAARSGALARVPGIGAATVERVLAHLDQMAAGPGRKLLLSEALLLGERIVSWLQEDSSCAEVQQAGSARRHQDLVSDLDFVASSRTPAALARRFLAYPGVQKVLSAGDGFCIALFAYEELLVQADLRIVDPESFGAGLHHFTGSKQHNIELRLYAQRRGLHVSEKGVWERKLYGRGHGEENRKIARRITSGRTEEDVFAALGVPFIPIELRVGSGEVKQALEGRLPPLVEWEHVRADLHLIVASAGDVAPLLAAASVARLETVGLVVDDDILASDEGIAIVRAARAFEAQSEGRGHGLTVMVVGRARITSSGDVELQSAARALAQLVLAESPSGDDITDAVERAVATGAIDILARPAGRSLPHAPQARADVWRVARACLAAGVLLEVGGDPRMLDLDESGCRVARDLGVPVVLASRAANADELVQMRFALWQARRGALPPALVRNAQATPAWLAWSRARGRAAPTVPAAHEPDALAVSLRGPLDDALRSRLDAFLRGGADRALERALLVDHPSALQGAFELLARVRVGAS